MTDQPPSKENKLPSLQDLFKPLQEVQDRYRGEKSNSNIPPGTVELLEESRDLHIYMKAHRDFLEVLTDVVGSKSKTEMKSTLEELLDERWRIQDKYEDYFVDIFAPKIK